MRVPLYRGAERGGGGAVVPLRIVIVTALAGVRGAVSLAGALTIPVAAVTAASTYPARDVGVSIAAVVIVVSLVSASVGLPLLLAGVDLPTTSTRDARRASLRVELARSDRGRRART